MTAPVLTPDIEALLTALTPAQQADSHTLMAMMKDLTGQDPKLSYNTIVGFGSYNYQYESGHSGSTALLAFAPKKDKFTLYMSPHLQEREDLLQQLGKYKNGKGCLYIKKMADVNPDILRQLMVHAITRLKELYAAYN